MRKHSQQLETCVLLPIFDDNDADLFELRRRLRVAAHFGRLAWPYALAVDRRAAAYVRAASFRHCLAYVCRVLLL
jgi:hypothetical protein